MEINRKVVASNFIWRLLERSSAQIVAFVVSIVLARVLDPVVYGTVAIVTVFTTILQVFVDSGFGTALIQKKDSDDLDFSTVFYFNLIICILLYGLIFLFAPLISRFYNNNELTPIVRVLSLVVVISGVKGIQISYVSKYLQFKKFFWSTLIGTLASAIIGILMAYKGFGVWALVAQNLTNQAIDTFVLWIIVKWRPKKQFSWSRLKTLFSFGWKMLASGLLETGYKELRSLIIGKKYSSEDLAYYTKAQQFPSLIITNVNSSIESVLLPTMSNAQKDINQVKKMTKRAISVGTFVIMPIMVGIAVCAESLVTVLLTEKWLPCVPFIRVFCITFALYPIHTANLNAMKALGRSDYFLKLEIIKKVIGLSILFSTMWISVEAIAWSMLASAFLSLIINAWPNKKLMNYSFREQLKDMLPSVIASLSMGALVYFIGYVNGSGLYTLFKQALIGISVYFSISAAFKLSPFEYVKSFFKKDVK